MRSGIWRSCCLLLLVFLTGCGSSLTIYDITSNPANYNGQEITVEGVYLWKPGNPGLSVLAKAVSTRNDGTDARPVDSLVWLDEFPAEASANLHRPIDSVYGAVRVKGKFETGAFGPDGSFTSRLVVQSAEAIEQVERVEYPAPTDAQPNQVSIYELAKNPSAYNGQTVTTRGMYYWTQASSGLLTTGVQSEKPLGDDVASGVNPQPMGTPISMEGFPPDLSSQLNVGPGNGFVWGLVEVTGTFQTGGQFGLEGRHGSQLILDPASVKPIK